MWHLGRSLRIYKCYSIYLGASRVKNKSYLVVHSIHSSDDHRPEEFQIFSLRAFYIRIHPHVLNRNRLPQYYDDNNAVLIWNWYVNSFWMWSDRKCVERFQNQSGYGISMEYLYYFVWRSKRWKFKCHSLLTSIAKWKFLTFLAGCFLVDSKIPKGGH